MPLSNLAPPRHSSFWQLSSPSKYKSSFHCGVWGKRLPIMSLDVSTLKKNSPKEPRQTTADVACVWDKKTTPYKSNERYKIVQVSQQGILKKRSRSPFWPRNESSLDITRPKLLILQLLLNKVNNDCCSRL
jgi:hypothetical protein